MWVNVISATLHFGCGISNMVGPKMQEFWPRINIHIGNHCILTIDAAHSCQKIGMNLGNNNTVFCKVNEKKQKTRNCFKGSDLSRQRL